MEECDYVHKMKFSLVEKRLFRIVIVLAFIQVLLIFIFVYMLIHSQQLDIKQTKQISIDVDDMYYYRTAKEYKLLVVADSKYYLFAGRSTFKERSVHDIYESISIGDQLSLTYYESNSIIWGQVNIVVDANSETETYRTLEEYNRGREGLPVFVVVLCSIIELIFAGVVFIYVWINYGIFKGVYRKIKKHSYRGAGSRPLKK